MAQVPSRSDSPFRSLQTSINELFSDFWSGPPVPDFSPAADIAETDNAITVKLDLPGIEEKAITVDLADGMLTVRGEKRTEREEKDKTFHLVERSSGSFTRSFSLPTNIDQQKVTAAYANGELTILLPKTNNGHASRRRISIGTK